MLSRMTTTSAPVGDLPLVEVLRTRRRSRELPPRPRRRAIREAAGASLSEVAAACGVSHYAVYCWEKIDGKIEPSAVNRPAYKRVLDALEELAREFNNTHK